MTKFMLIYTGGMGMEADPEEQQKIMAEWGAWYDQLGAAIVDGGAPFAESKHVTSSGTGDGPGGGTPATGYTVIEADSLDAAVAKCENHPHINHGGDVAVYTCVDMSPQQ